MYSCTLYRFGKHRPDAWWFKIHRVIQSVGLLLALIAWGIALRNFEALEAKGTMNFNHAVIGMVTMIIGLIQPINAIFRPHAPKENEEKTTLRFVWEICHRGLGWIGILLGFATIWMGTTLLSKDDKRSFQLCYGVLVLGCLVLLSSFLLLEKKQDKYNQVPAKEKNDPEAEVEDAAGK